MRRPGDFSAFNFEPTNYDLFQRQIIWAWHENDVTVTNSSDTVFLQTVIKVVY